MYLQTNTEFTYSLNFWANDLLNWIRFFWLDYETIIQGIRNI
jgi:hypothetical protein